MVVMGPLQTLDGVNPQKPSQGKASTVAEWICDEEWCVEKETKMCKVDWKNTEKAAKRA